MKATIPPLDLLSDEKYISQSEVVPIVLSEKVQWKLLIAALIFIDLTLTALAFVTAYIFRFLLSIPVFYLYSSPSFPFYTNLVLILIPVWVGIFSLMGLYDRHHILSGTREYGQLFNASTLGILIFMAIGFFSDSIVIARGWLILSWFFTFSYLTLGRFIIRRVVRLFRQKGFFLSRTLVVGVNRESVIFTEQLLNSIYSGMYIVGFVDQVIPVGTNVVHSKKCLGDLSHLQAIIDEYKAQDVVITSSALSREETLEIFTNFGVSKQVNLLMSSGLFEILTTGLKVREYASVPLVGVNKLRMTGTDLFLKTVMDYSIAIIGLLLASPLFMLIAVAIKLDSKGPIFYRRKVLGVNGHQFDAFKFRTMFVDGDKMLASFPDLVAEWKKNQKLKIDPRITRVGRILRKTSLDEIPQLFNVLKNEMTLVGPRMIVLDELENYDQWGMNLLTVKPGLTGLWQVSGRSDLTYNQRVNLDMYYIRNWSIWLDLKLLFQTIPAVLKRRGAY